MAKKNFLNATFGRKIDVDNINTNENTKKVIKEAIDHPTKEHIIDAIEVIREDDIISDTERKELIKSFQDQFTSIFNFNNCPDDYESLKKEAKFLSKMTQYSFLLMAQRLLKIRDNQLYTGDGYDDFKSFIENELPIAKTTVYCYIDVYTLFGVQTSELDVKIDYSKLFPVLPILKSERDDIPKDQLKSKFIREAQQKSAREIKDEAKELKIKYGLFKKGFQKPNFEKVVENFKKNIPFNPD